LRIKTETSVGLFMILALIIFLFMSFRIGIWRLDTVKYAHYIAYFSDVSGLNEKSDILIAGVKVGWVQKLSLVARHSQVRVDMMIDRNSIIYSNAHSSIRQNGLLGTKYVEVFPGDPEHPILPAGSTLMQPNKPAVAIDEILSVFKEIADNVNDVTQSLKKVVGDEKNNQNLIQLVSDAQKAFQAINETAISTNNLIKNNNSNISSIVQDLSYTLHEMREKLPGTFDSVKETAESISKSITKAGDTITDAVIPIKKISENLEKGSGIMGSLMSDENLAKEFKTTVSGLKKYFSYADRIGIDVDTHVESMQGVGNDLDFKDAKGYMNFLVRPSDDIAYLLGVTSSYAGVVKRTRTDTIWADQAKKQMIPANMELRDWEKLFFAPVKEEYKRDYSALTLNAQFAKEFGRLQCRAGIFENSFGFGFDYDIPLIGDTKWITSFELFRFNEFMSQTLGGRMVFDIDMPHLKWYNKIYVNDNCYFVFGADDFISKFNKNFFVGLGIAFEQDDLKYVASSVGLNSLANKS
jgi:phospholipid/cholesterol/gamma-HCH transport system substrate-binding protein